jgi:hypothetical protein
MTSGHCGRHSSRRVPTENDLVGSFAPTRLTCPAANIRVGFKNGNVRARAARLFYPQVQTSSACPGMSVWCQRTFADIAAPYSGCQRTSTPGFGFSLTGQMCNSHRFFPSRPSIVASPNERKAAPLRRCRPPPHCSQSCWRVRLCGGDDLIGRLALRGRFASASSAKVCVNLRK